MNMDYSAWEGYEIDGHVDWVMSRGTVIVDETGYVGTKGHGAVPQARPQPVPPMSCIRELDRAPPTSDTSGRISVEGS